MARKCKLWTVLFESVKIALVITLVVLHALSTKTAGLSHHLYYKQRYYQHHLFTAEKMGMLIVAILLADFVAMFIRRKKKTETKAYPLCFWSAALLLALLLPQVGKLLIFPYMIGILAINWFISWIQSTLCSKGKGAAI